MQRKAEIFGGIGAIISFAVLLWWSVNSMSHGFAVEDARATQDAPEFVEKKEVIQSFKEIWVLQRLMVQRLEALEKKAKITPLDDPMTRALKERVQLKKKDEKTP